MLTSTPQGKKHLLFFFGFTKSFSLTGKEETFTRIDTVLFTNVALSITLSSQKTETHNKALPILDIT